MAKGRSRPRLTVGWAASWDAQVPSERYINSHVMSISKYITQGKINNNKAWVMNTNEQKYWEA